MRFVCIMRNKRTNDMHCAPRSINDKNISVIKKKPLFLFITSDYNIMK